MDKLTTLPVSLPRPRAGRPTREQAVARQHELLDCALDHFLDKGFGGAAIDAIASDVGMTKRTVYSRYPDKVALFRAAVRHAIERYVVTEEQIRATEAGDLEQTLVNIARLRIGQISTPEGLRLQRIVTSEAHRFPDIFDETYRQGMLPTVRFLADILEREARAGRLVISDPEKTADVFVAMLASGPIRLIVSGDSLPRQVIDEQVDFAVRLFLDGARPR